MMFSRRVSVIMPRATDTDKVVLFGPGGRWVQIGGRATRPGPFVILVLKCG